MIIIVVKIKGYSAYLKTPIRLIPLLRGYTVPFVFDPQLGLGRVVGRRRIVISKFGKDFADDWFPVIACHSANCPDVPDAYRKKAY